MSKIQNENYIVLQGWMSTELHLKGNELIIYACIYGFTQAENQKFTGSLQYLADWTSSTKQGVIKALKSLQEKGLIMKNETYLNGVKFCEYYSTKFNTPIQQSLTGGIKQSLTNNIDNNNKDNINKRESSTPPTLEEIELYAKERNSSVNPKAFYEFFTADNDPKKHWTDSKGNKVKNWKQKFLTWENHEKQSKDEYIHNKYVKEQHKDLITDLDNVEI